MRNPYIASRPGSAGTAGDEVGGALERAGFNFGNLLFFSSLRRVVAHDEPSQIVEFNPNTIRERHDGIVVPAANWLQGSKDFGGLAARIERANLPVCVVGLGAQSFGGEMPKLTPGTLRFLRAVSDRSATISVRGEFSADVLRHYGFRNVEVTGCPSLLWHVDRPLRVSPSTGRTMSLSGTQGDGPEGMSSQHYALGRRLARLAVYLDLDYVAQTEFDDMLVSTGAKSATDGVLAQVSVADGSKDYLKRRLRYFYNVQDWMAYTKGVDLTFGSRLHGCIVALLAGRPALLIGHDSRTREMAEFAAIPTIPADYVLSGQSVHIDDLMKFVDVDKINRRQPEIYAGFIRFFRRNDVANNLKPQTAPKVPA